MYMAVKTSPMYWRGDVGIATGQQSRPLPTRSHKKAFATQFGLSEDAEILKAGALSPGG